MESEEEALFRSYPYAVYFVQSPSNISHANSTTTNIHNNNSNNNNNVNGGCYDVVSVNQEGDGHGLSLSRYSSSRGSNNSSSQHFKKLSLQINPKLLLDHHHDHIIKDHCQDKEEILIDDHDHDDDDDEYDRKRSNETWIKYFSLGYSNSGWWIVMQLSWRFLVSLIIALLVFYVAAKPPHPNVAIKVARIPQFRLGEGVDSSGVTTKILSCNFSINVIIDNDSKLFALHIQPPIIKLMFGRLTFAMSQKMQGRELYAGNDDLTMLRFNVGTKNKAMYGAGRNMQDFLESEKGLALIMKVSLRSRFNVIWGIFQPKYNHQAQCLVVLSDHYDKTHRSQVYNSTCVINSV